MERETIVFGHEKDNVVKQEVESYVMGLERLLCYDLSDIAGIPNLKRALFELDKNGLYGIYWSDNVAISSRGDIKRGNLQTKIGINSDRRYLETMTNLLKGYCLNKRLTQSKRPIPKKLLELFDISFTFIGLLISLDKK